MKTYKLTLVLGVDKDVDEAKLADLERHAEKIVNLDECKEIKNIYSAQFTDLSDIEEQKNTLFYDMSRKLNGALYAHSIALRDCLDIAYTPIEEFNETTTAAYKCFQGFLEAFDKYLQMRLDQCSYM